MNNKKYEKSRSSLEVMVSSKDNKERLTSKGITKSGSFRP